MCKGNCRDSISGNIFSINLPLALNNVIFYIDNINLHFVDFANFLVYFKEAPMKKFMGTILAGIIFFVFSSTVFAEQSTIVGTLEIGRTIWGVSSSVSVPVRYLVQNSTDDPWAVSGPTNSAFMYVVYNVQSGQQVATGG
jgi:hypothetical protein